MIPVGKIIALLCVQISESVVLSLQSLIIFENAVPLLIIFIAIQIAYTP